MLQMSIDTVCKQDVSILRELAEHVAAIAALPIQAERVQLWATLNSLNPIRPVVVVYPARAWAELVPTSSLACRDSLFREWELELRQTIFQYDHINDDRPIHNEFHVPRVVRLGSMGVDIKELHAEGDGPKAIRATNV
jgi:hypothetical protein